MILLEHGPSKLNVITLIIISAISANSFAEEIYSFDDTFIKGRTNKADFSKYTSDELTEGNYSLDVFTNGEWKGKYDFAVKKQADGAIGICYSEEMLTKFGISTEQLNAALAKTTGYCGTLKSWNGADEVSDRIIKSTFRLEITVPQIYENNLYKNYVDPSRWDSGIPALNVSWNANVWNSHYSDNGSTDSTYGYLGFNSTASVAGWALKNRSQITWNDKQSAKFESSQFYLERPIPALKSTLSVGQVSGTGEFFDSVSLRGATLRTDTQMLPDVMTNFIPEIRGTAQTNALVTVRQDGRVIYETSVPAGPFALTDVFPRGFGSNLDVTVKESNGSETHFMVPYNSGAKLLHPGVFKYEAAVGKPDSSYSIKKPVIYQGAIEYGLNNYFTGYLGVNGFNNYNAYLAGVGLNTPIGGLSLDATNSRLKTKKIASNGNMFRASYTRSFDATNTSLSFVGLKYSDKGYYSLNNALIVNDGSVRSIANEKTSLSLSVNQKLPEGWGTLYATGRLVDRWDTDQKIKQYQLSYSNNYDRLRYSVSVQRAETKYRNELKNDTQIGISFSLPLYSGNDYSNTISSRTKINNGKYANTQTGLTGSINNDYHISYGLNTTVGDYRDVSVNVGARAQWANINSTYSQGSDYRQVSASGSGSVIGHSGGFIFTPETGDTIAIVEAKGAKGASIASSVGAKINNQGYGVMTSLRPYRINNVEVDPKGSPDNVYFNETLKQTVPYAGSVVKVSFDTEVQDNLNFKGKFKDGRPFPFGATIYNTRGEEIGMVGQGGNVLIQNASDAKAVLKWKDGSCTFTLPKENSEVTCD